jgi:hypothetical protein
LILNARCLVDISRLSRARLTATGAALLLLAACGNLPGALGESPGLAAATPSITAAPPAPSTPEPIVDGTPSLVLEPPEFVASATPTRISLTLPQERIIIEAPGPGSQVVSPVRVAGWGGPSSQGKIFIRLIGEQGQVIARTTTYILAPDGSSGQFVIVVPFTIAGVAEAGLVEVSYNDYTTGRLEHISTRPVVLLSVGPGRVHTNQTTAEKLSLFSPRQDQVLRGGLISVSGAALLDEDLPLLIEVLDRAGEVIASTEVEVQAPVLGELGTFQAQLPYSVPYGQYGRVAITERGLTPPAVRHYTSVRLYLEP